MPLPKSLKYGDTIGIYSPSSPVIYTSPKRFERAKSYLMNTWLLLFYNKSHDTI